MANGYVDIRPQFGVPDLTNWADAVNRARGQGLQQLGEGVGQIGTGVGMLLHRRMQQEGANKFIQGLLQTGDEMDKRVATAAQGLPPDVVVGNLAPRYLIQRARGSATGSGLPIKSIWRNQETGEWRDSPPQPGQEQGWVEYQMKSSQAGQTMSQQTYQGTVSWDHATQDQKDLAMRLVRGETNPWTLDYRGPLRRGLIISLASQYAQKENIPFQSYSGAVKESGAKYFAGGAGAKTAMSINMALNHLDGAMTVYEKMGNKSATVGNMEVRLANIPINKLKLYTNDPDIASLEANLVALHGELATAFTGKAGTDQEIQQWRNVLSPDLTTDQYIAVGQKINELLMGRQHAAEYQLKSVGSQDIFQRSILSPEAEQTQERFKNLKPKNWKPPPMPKPYKDPKEEAEYQEWKKKQLAKPKGKPNGR